MNRGVLRSSLISRLGIPTAGDGLLTTTELNSIIDIALRDIGQEYDWPWLVTSSSLTFTSGAATVPTGFVKARELVVNSRRAKFLPLSAYLDAAAKGVECVWTETGTTVRLTPVPSTSPTNTFWYIQSEPALSADASEPLLPDAYHQLLLARCSYHANTRRNRNEEAARDDNEYQLGVRKMKDASWTRTGPRYVKPAGVSMWAQW